jgi:hypothetical protein
MTDERNIEREKPMNNARTSLRPPSSVLLWSVRFIVVAAFILWSATQLDGFSWDYDEGVHVYIAWLVQQGHPLYIETFSPYTPGFILPLVAAFQVFGATMFVARMVAVVCAAFGVLGVMWVAGEMCRGEASSPLLPELAAAAMLIFTPSFYQWSRAAMSDLPSAAVAAFAVAWALRYARNGQLRCLFTAQIFLAVALWMKLIAIGSAVPLALVMLVSLWPRRAAVRRALIGTLIVSVLSLLPLLAFDVRGLYEQAIYFHIQKRAAYEFSLSENLQILLDFLGNNLTLLALVISNWLQRSGTLALVIRERSSRQSAILKHRFAVINDQLPITNYQLPITLSWFVATFIALLLQTPLFANHHPVVMMFPLAVMAGTGFTKVISHSRFVMSWLMARLTPSSLSPSKPFFRGLEGHSFIPKPFFRGSSLHLVTLSLTLVCIAAAVVDAQTYRERWQAAATPAFQPVAEEALVLLKAVTPAQDLLVSDGIMIAFRAQRQSPPALSDVSNARLQSGNLTAEQLITVTQQSQVNGVLFWSDRLASAQAFVKWTEQNYYPVRSSFQKPNSPYRLLLREPHPQYPLDARIGEGIRLWGYDVQRRATAPIVAGQTLSLTLYFQRIGNVERAYTVFAHLLALRADGQLVAQADHPPFTGRYPTDQWLMNEWIVDEFMFTLAPDLPAGNYTIALGMYQGDTRAPLTWAGVRQADGRLLLPPVSIRGTR